MSIIVDDLRDWWPMVDRWSRGEGEGKVGERRQRSERRERRFCFIFLFSTLVLK